MANKQAAVVVRKMKNDKWNRWKVYIKQSDRKPVEFIMNIEEQAKNSADEAVKALKRAGYTVKTQGF